MQRFSLYRFLEQISDTTFFLALFFFQFLFIFQGIDFADEGFHLTFYQLFFVHPESTVMNMMYWLTGLTGGSFFYLFPSSGILGLRLLGILTILLTSFVAYSILKKHINTNNLRISILIVSIFVNSNDLKILYYDNLSALLSIAAAFFLYSGLVNKKLLQIAISGALISLGMFARLPGITLLVLVSAIIYYGFISTLKISQLFKQSFFFTIGFFGMTAAVLLLMKSLGQFDYYLENLKIVFAWGGSTEDAHNIQQLARNFLNSYSQSVIRIIFLLCLLILANYFISLLQRTKLPIKLITNAVILSIGLLFVYFLVSNKITYAKLLSFFAGISILVSLLILISRKYSNETKLLVFIGLLILIFAPLGSAGGLFGHGRNTFWIVLPFAIDFIFNISSVRSTIDLSDKKNGSESFLINFESYQVQLFRNYFFSVCLIAGIYFAYFYPYFDMSNRIKMFSAINNKFTRGILTTNERATAINELLVESSKHVKKNDLVLAYDCIPMFHFLTETRPFMPNSWPWLYLPETFDIELNKATKNSGRPRVIVLQKMSTMNNDWPIRKHLGYIKSSPDTKRDSMLINFIGENNYAKVWENEVFEIQIERQYINRSIN